MISRDTPYVKYVSVLSGQTQVVDLSAIWTAILAVNTSMAHATPRERCISADRTRRCAKLTQESYRVMSVLVTRNSARSSLTFDGTDWHRQRNLPRGHHGRAARRPCAQVALEVWDGLQGELKSRFSLIAAYDLIPVQHGTGHGVGAYLTVHEGPHGFSAAVPLVPGHVIINEPGFCK